MSNTKIKLERKKCIDCHCLPNEIKDVWFKYADACNDVWIEYTVGNMTENLELDAEFVGEDPTKVEQAPLDKWLLNNTDATLGEEIFISYWW